MNCATCNIMLVKTDIGIDDRVIHICPNGCHMITIFTDGSQHEEFSINVSGHYLSVENRTEQVKIGRSLYKTVKCAVFRLNGWEINRINELVPTGSLNYELV